MLSCIFLIKTEDKQKYCCTPVYNKGLVYPEKPSLCPDHAVGAVWMQAFTSGYVHPNILCCSSLCLSSACFSWQWTHRFALLRSNSDSL